MIVARIPTATRVLGAPPGWDPSKGHCGGLPIEDIETTQGPAMQSSWEPTPDELDRLNRGAKVTLMVMGYIHPPVMLSVGMVPKEAADG